MGPTPGRNLHQIVDRQLGLVAAAFELPDGWQASSGLSWHLDQPSVPVTSWARAVDPETGLGIDVLPTENYFWLQPDPGMMRKGTVAAGQTYLPMTSATDALVGTVIPKYLGRDVRVIGAGPTPDLLTRLGLDARPSQPEPVEQFAGAAARVQRTDGAALIDQEFHAVAYYREQAPQYGPLGPLLQTDWGFIRLLSFYAPAGALDGRHDMLWNLVAGMNVNPLWQSRSAEVMHSIQQMAQAQLAQGYANIYAAGQLSRQISANNDAMLAGMAASRQAEHQRDAADRQAAAHRREPGDGFDDYIRGVETYDDPYWGTSQQDANARYAWTDGSGQYRLSDDPFFDPNQGSSQSWTLMTPAR